jgi:hypothetical protein
MRTASRITVGTVDSCRNCGKRLRYRRFEPGELEEFPNYRTERWVHAEGFHGQLTNWNGEPEGPVLFILTRCNPKHLPESGEEQAWRWRKSAEPANYCLEIQESDGEVCYRKITDREYMMCGLHARPHRQRRLEQEESRRKMAEAKEKQALAEYEDSLIEKDMSHLPPALAAKLEYRYRGRNKTDDDPIRISVNLYELLELLGIEV